MPRRILRVGADARLATPQQAEPCL
ncbi:MAG: hypothetical protein JWP04_3756, partial [Belnapia sp.]|nr:hypothetical protein [Belnapia sp.]